MIRQGDVYERCSKELTIFIVSILNIHFMELRRYNTSMFRQCYHYRLSLYIERACDTSARLAGVNSEFPIEGRLQDISAPFEGRTKNRVKWE